MAKVENGPQLHVGYQVLDKWQDNDISHYPGKPGPVLWTSSLQNGRSEWIEYVASVLCNSWHKETTNYVHLLIPQPTAKVLTIRSPKDFKKLPRVNENYGEDLPDVDWNKISESYDAVRCISRSIQKEYHWNVESTAWFRNVFISDVVVGRVDTKPGSKLFILGEEYGNTPS